MSELAETAKAVGELLPVLVNKKGEVIDGRHRLQANKNWRRSELDLNDLQTHVARLIINTQRRMADVRDYYELAKFLQKTEPGERSYLVKSGKTIVERINELTNIPIKTLWSKIDREFKQPGHSSVDSALGEGTTIRIPEPVVASVQQAVQELKKTVEEHPEQKKEIIRDFKEGVRFAAIASKPIVPIVERETPEPKFEPKPQTIHTFMKSLHQWSRTTLIIEEIPVGVLTKIMRDMDKETLEEARTSVRIILQNTRKLQQALEAVA